MLARNLVNTHCPRRSVVSCRLRNMITPLDSSGDETMQRIPVPNTVIPQCFTFSRKHYAVIAQFLMTVLYQKMAPMTSDPAVFIKLHVLKRQSLFITELSCYIIIFTYSGQSFILDISFRLRQNNILQMCPQQTKQNSALML